MANLASRINIWIERGLIRIGCFVCKYYFTIMAAYLLALCLVVAALAIVRLL